MSKKLIIFICGLNTLLGVGVLLFVLKPQPTLFDNDWDVPAQTNASEYSDDELWTMARASTTTGQALERLQQLSTNDATIETMAGEIDRIGNTAPLPFEQWPLYEALLIDYGSRAASVEVLQPLAAVARQSDNPLTLRETAFRSFIQNFSRIGSDHAQDAADPGNKTEGPASGSALREVYTLIDALRGERNHLAGMTLQAEDFLGQGGFRREQGDLLAQRATAMLLDDSALEKNRLSAASVLHRISAYPGLAELRTALEGTASERLRVALLQIIAAADFASEELIWLEAYRAVSREQEGLVQRILSRTTQAAMPAPEEP